MARFARVPARMAGRAAASALLSTAIRTNVDYPRGLGAFNSGACSSPNCENDIGGIANSRNDLFGQDLADFIKRGSKQLSRLQAFCEELPNADNRVDLATQKLTSVLEPLIIVLLACVVAGIVVAIVMPLLQLQRT